MKTILSSIKCSKILILVSLFLSACSGYVDDVISLQEEDMERTSRATVQYDYPNVWEIINDYDIYNDMWDAWYTMYRKQTDEYRFEVGFYIYYDESKQKLYTGDLFYGPKLYYKDHDLNCASLTYGEITNKDHLCAFFHCHPPYKSYTEVRPLGPSDKDKETAYKLGIPGILIDYDSERYINANFEYDDMIPLILNFGPERRANRE